MHIVHGELRKAPFIKQLDGGKTMFAVELSEMIKDYKTGEKTYTNYKALLFASSQAHVDYYTSSLVEGNFIVVNCEKLKIEVSECGKYTKLFMDNARLEGSGFVQAGNQQQAPQQQQNQGQQQQAPRQQAPQQQQVQQPQPQAQPQAPMNEQQANDEWSDDIPF